MAATHVVAARYHLLELLVLRHNRSNCAVHGTLLYANLAPMLRVGYIKSIRICLKDYKNISDFGLLKVSFQFP